MPTIAADFSTEPARAGVLIAAYMLPFGLFQLVYGPLADRFGKLRVVTISLVLFTGATALCATAVGIHDLTAVRALTGIFAAATMPVSLALIGDLVPMKQRQQAIASFMGIAFLGQATSMTIGGTIATLSSWRGVFVVYAVVAAIIVAALYLSTRSLHAQMKGDPHSQFLRPYGRLLAHGPSLRTYLLVFVEGVLILGSFSYAGAYAAKVLGLETLGIGLLMAVFGAGVIGGSRFSGRLATRLGRSRLVALGLSSAAAADLLLATAGAHLAAFAVAILLLGLGFMFAHSSLLTIVTGFAERARGAAMSLIAFAFMVGGSGGTMLGGRIILGAGYETLYLGFGLALAALGVAALVALPADRLGAGSAGSLGRPTGRGLSSPARLRPGASRFRSCDRVVPRHGRPASRIDARPVRHGDEPRPGPRLSHRRFLDIVERLRLADDLIETRTRFLDDEYARNLVLRTPHFELLVLCWRPGQRSTIHDHAGSLNAIRVRSGELTSRVFRPVAGVESGAGPVERCRRSAWARQPLLGVDRGGIHQLADTADAPLVTIHVYAPPLLELTVFDTESAVVEKRALRYSLAEDL